MIVAGGLLLTAVIVAGYDYGLGVSGRVGHARAMALAIFSLASAALAGALSGLRTWASRVVTCATAAASVALIQVPRLAALVHVDPLHLTDWAGVVAGTVLAAAIPRAVPAFRSPEAWSGGAGNAQTPPRPAIPSGPASAQKA